VLDADSHVVSVERQDGSADGRFEIAFGKAALNASAVRFGDRAPSRTHQHYAQ
jgi:uncharacterized protein GlcG (DUF336 family)